MEYSVLQQISDALSSDCILYSREGEAYLFGVRGASEMSLREASAEGELTFDEGEAQNIRIGCSHYTVA